MVIGALICPAAKSREVAEEIRSRKRDHGLAAAFEVKWTKVSPAKLDFYLSLLDYFLSDADLRFRAVIVPDKTLLRHEDFHQNQDTFYYKMYYTMLKAVLSPDAAYRIFLDIKDTRSAAKERKLHDILRNSVGDFDQHIIRSLQSVRSHEVQQIQLADLLTGVVSYSNRFLRTSEAKSAVVSRLESGIGSKLTRNTPLSARKVNLLVWRAAPPT